MIKTIFAYFLVFFTFILSAQGSYWQQAIDYDMSIDVDVKNGRYTGNQKIVYTNNSPDKLDKVYFHLYWNAFQPGSAMDYHVNNMSDPDKRVVINGVSKISKLKVEDIGYQKITSLLQSGEKVDFFVDGTILEVKLNSPLLPNTKTTFDMTWNSQVPSQIRRSGKNNSEGIELSMTQWYPKMAEYDKNGWQVDHYISREFHGVWGNFDVKINIDNNYVIGSSGVLQNTSDKKGYSNIYKKSKGKTTWRFIAKNIHDFAWAADPDFKVDKMNVQGGTTLYFIYQKDKPYSKTWGKIQEPTVLFFNYMNKKFGQYPWETYTIVQGGDGGMEYGTATLITGDRNFESLYGVIFHEAAHSWFQHLFATDETLFAWMDEGFTSYADALAQNFIFSNKNKELNPAIDSYRGYFYMAESGKEEPLNTLADHFKTNQNYGLASYYKGQVFCAQLEYIVGKENMDKAWLKYYEKWKFKHPTANDFRRVVEEVSNINLKWYFNLWVGTTKTIDYKVVSKSNKKIALKRIGDIPMPLDVYVQYEDDSTEVFYIPLMMMRGQKPKDVNVIYKTADWTQLNDWVWTNPDYTITTSKEVKSVFIDITQRLADINFNDNIKK